ncbi:hypothetical protein L6Q21_09320 [Sandaracinobacter sp. RS1-74]|uniref:DUF7832 domain-containing protein n=1 Tax=Sandaracinobacteroides sayramensis TaxID=2913411 RepID=UPI001EDC6D4E|nr:hypothetical protein [Sandaracinobacteroides sayramensis]MCG2841178.1 hypothetical protein [Sandaracinobacteroides sayramensis]
MQYDDASWHYGGDFPAGLPQAAAATHIAMFMGWMLLNGQGSGNHGQAVEALRRREITPGAWFLMNCDEKLTDEDLSDDGNRFAESYYLHDEGRFEAGEASYLVDYMGLFPGAAEAYAVPDDWSSYDRLAPILAHRFALWRGLQLGMEKGRG